MAINADGVFFCNRAVLPGMIRRRSGRIVNLASIAGKMVERIPMRRMGAPDEVALRDHLAWPWSAWDASAARDGTVQRGSGLGADPTVDGETIRFLECDDGRFRKPTEGPVGRTGIVAGP
jgi:short chain dehydrogenase